MEDLSILALVLAGLLVLVPQKFRERLVFKAW